MTPNEKINQETADKALLLLKMCIASNPSIDIPHWVVAMVASLANIYFHSGVTFENFAKDMIDSIVTYKSQFKENA